MLFEKITLIDIEEVAELQPEGWTEIKSKFHFYVENDFCFPFKMIIDKRIVGLGCSIVFENTAWLAHIIVGSQFRNRGIGFQVVENLLAKLKENTSIESVLLIATKMGEPVYKRAGFREVNHYLLLNREKPWGDVSISKNIVDYQEGFYGQILELDKNISGESREPLIKQYLYNSKVYLEENQVKGYFLPDLGDGLLFADCETAGIELMKYKYSKMDRAIIPSENKVAIDFLTKNGFSKPVSENKRMVKGVDLNWQPENFYSRIGGNFG